MTFIQQALLGAMVIAVLVVLYISWDLYRKVRG